VATRKQAATVGVVRGDRSLEARNNESVRTRVLMTSISNDVDRHFVDMSLHLLGSFSRIQCPPRIHPTR
jgi:hypothetical protein